MGVITISKVKSKHEGTIVNNIAQNFAPIETLAQRVWPCEIKATNNKVCQPFRDLNQVRSLFVCKPKPHSCDREQIKKNGLLLA